MAKYMPGRIKNATTHT